MYFSISLVNLTLGALQGGRILDNQSAPLTIDFLPGEDIRGQRIRVVTEETIVAMFQCALSPVSDEPVVAAPAIPTLMAIARQRLPARIFRYTPPLPAVSGFVSHECRVARQQRAKIE